MTLKHLIDGKEVAEQIGIGKMLFYKLRREGKFPLTPVAGKYFSRAQVLAWLDAGCPDAETWENVKADFLKKGAFTDGSK